MSNRRLLLGLQQDYSIEDLSEDWEKVAYNNTYNAGGIKFKFDGESNQRFKDMYIPADFIDWNDIVQTGDKEIAYAEISVAHTKLILGIFNKEITIQQTSSNNSYETVSVECDGRKSKATSYNNGKLYIYYNRISFREANVNLDPEIEEQNFPLYIHAQMADNNTFTSGVFTLRELVVGLSGDAENTYFVMMVNFKDNKIGFLHRRKNKIISWSYNDIESCELDSNGTHYPIIHLSNIR